MTEQHKLPIVTPEIEAKMKRDKLIHLLCESEHKLIAFHEECKKSGLIPEGFAAQWEIGMNMIQSCLMAHQTLVAEGGREMYSFR